jgi:hypothetical protein
MGYSLEPEADIAQQTLMLIPLIDVGLAVRSAPRKAGEFEYSPRRLLLRDRSPSRPYWSVQHRQHGRALPR